jgi:formate dehydrogenase iron-sulfur subunit
MFTKAEWDKSFIFNSIRLRREWLSGVYPSHDRNRARSRQPDGPDGPGTHSGVTWLSLSASAMPRASGLPRCNLFRANWLMMSDVCKHCSPAPCLEACPTGALFRTEFDTVVVQQDVCDGCGYCVPARPFGVVDLNHADGKAHKCTLCYDRLKGGLEPACAKACPTDSIQFGELAVLHECAQQRVEALRAQGRDDAYLYGTPNAPGATGGIAQLHAFFLLTDHPEVYNLPAHPRDNCRPVFVIMAPARLALLAAPTRAVSQRLLLALRRLPLVASGMVEVIRFHHAFQLAVHLRGQSGMAQPPAPAVASPDMDAQLSGDTPG